jgi:structural maintenance of chromosome 1
VARKSPKELTSLFEYISGSDQFKEEYESTLQKREAARQNAMFLETKRKGMKNDRRDMKDQKKEADDHARLAEQLKALKKKQILFQLYYIESDIASLMQELEAKELELAEVAARLKQGEDKVPELRAKHARTEKDLDEAEQALKEHEKAMERAKPDMLMKENQLGHQRRKLEALQREVEEAKLKREKMLEKQTSLERELKALNDQEEAFKKENEAAMALGGKTLSEAEMKEYAQIKEKTRTSTSADRAQLGSLEREQNSEETMFEEVHKPRMADLKEKIRLLELEELPSVSRRISALETMHGELQAEKKKYESERMEIEQANASIIAEKATLDEELAEIQEELKTARVAVSETERQTKMSECLQTMKRLFPGVHGRIIDLVQAAQDRYRLALTVALGANMDAIVVADQSTAIECIQFMKEQRIGIATFIPLDSIRTNVSYDRLRLLEPGVIKPIIDVLKYDSAYQTAMEYVCGNTLICADLDRARYWAFQTGKRHKVVTYEGILIAKSGFMTGGVSGFEASVGRWNTKQIAELSSRRDSCIAKLSELNNQMRNVARERELQSLVATLTVKVESCAADLKAADEQRKSLQKRIAEAKASEKKNQAAYDELEKKLDSRRPALQALKNKIAAVEDVAYAEFSKRVGVPNIREWEETRKVRLKALAEKGLTFKTQRARIQNLLDYATQQASATDYGDLVKQSRDIEASIAQIESEIKAKQSELESLQEKIKLATQVFQEAKRKNDAANKALREALRDNETRKLLKMEHSKQKEAKEVAMEQLKAKRHQVLASARADDVDLPRILKGKKKKQKTTPKKKRRAEEEPEEEEEEEEEESEEAIEGLEEEPQATGERMDIDEPSLPMLQATQTMTGEQLARRTKREDKIVVDFSHLENKLKQCHTVAQREENLATIIADIQSVSAKLETIAPNFKAMDKLDALEVNIETIDQEIQEAHQLAQRYRDQHLDVRSKRLKTFAVAFQHINDQINAVYKALTGGFGQATLEGSVDDPYAQPINYSLAPKSKAYTDIQNLSGGEQSVAALALIFAIQSFRPSPFFILDEVDASLDAKNVGVVVEYFKRRSNETQFIIISLKDKFFDKADALVGICQDRATATSRCLTLDLNAMCGPYEL